MEALVSLRYGLTSELELMTDYRGCVTPVNIKSWQEVIDGDMDMCDGYEELPEEYQEKVARALKQGHVDDEDWKWVRRGGILR